MHVVAIAAGPAHALYFSCYERMKILLSGTSQAGHNPMANGLAGCFATLLHDALMVPADGKLTKFFANHYEQSSSDQTATAGLCLSVQRRDRLSSKDRKTRRRFSSLSQLHHSVDDEYSISFVTFDHL